MGKVFLVFLIFCVTLATFINPWVAGLAYSFNSLLQPHYLWHWVFEGIPIFKITAVLSLVAFCIQASRSGADFTVYRNKQTFLIISLLVWMHFSNLFSSFPGSSASVSPQTVLDTMNAIVLMYLVLVFLFNNDVGLKHISHIFLFSFLYYVYWANSAYFNQEWFRFVNNRLVGPSMSPYNDANVLSTLIVMGLPFLMLFFFRTKKILVKVAVLLVVPFAWHALILFSSRAALLASAISIIVFSFVIKSKSAKLLTGLAFLIFIIYQGSLLIERTTSTIEHARVQQEEPVNPRLVSWTAALKLIPIYPVFGVGVQMFEAATDYHFPGMTPHVAHNTFLNFSANSGLPSGIMFSLLLVIPMLRFKQILKTSYDLSDVGYYTFFSSSISIIGFAICSIFLDLIVFEPFYFALMINLLSWRHISEKN